MKTKAPTQVPEYKCLNFKNGCERGAFLYPRSISIDPHFEEGYEIHYHQGIDIGGVDGKTEIISVVAGKVRLASSEPVKGYGGYGRFVEIEGVDGRYYLHAHCAEVLVKTGDPVDEKTPIAIVGRTAFEGDEATQHEKNHCEALKAWRDTGSEGKPPEPPKAQIKNKNGELVDKRWMGPHLHFEVSRHPFGSSHATIAAPVPEPGNQNRKIKVDRSIEGEHREFTEDPREVLADLGPWGSTGATPPKLLLPGGQRVTPTTSEALHRSIEQQSLGGYFPIGANNFWHGGVHLFGRMGDEIVAPFDATIVAVRLDENSESTNQDFGSTNFILLKHEIPKTVVEQLAPVETKHDGSASGKKEAPAPDTASVGQRERTAETKVPANNPPEYVVEAKRRLRACPRPGTSPPEPFYAGSDRDLESEDADDLLINAIRAFQVEVVGLKRPDAVMSMVPERRTYSALRARTPSIKTVAESQAPDNSVQLQGTEPEAPSNVEVVYSLYMHVEAREIDAARAKQVPWLGRVRLGTNEEQPEPEDERQEAARSMTGDVGPANKTGVENDVEDVRWVQKRLSRFKYFDKDKIDGRPSTDLVSAIERFQAEHSMKASGRAPDGIVSRNANTYQWLQKTPDEIAEANPASSTIDVAFLKRIRERDAEGTCKVVSDLSVKVSAGEVLGTVGPGGDHSDIGRSALIHWEIFSEKPLMASWLKLEDANADLSIDVTEPIVAAIEHLTEVGSDEGTLTTDQVIQYYTQGFGANLRQVQCLFPNEWSHDPGVVESAFAELGDPLADCVREQVKPYLWWSQAQNVLPPSGKVWHYNPVAFMAEYARASGALAGSLSVIVKHEGKPIGGAEVKVSSREQDDILIRTAASGSATAQRLNPGLYRVAAFVGRTGAYSTDVMSAEVNVALEPAEDAAVTLELR